MKGPEEDDLLEDRLCLALYHASHAMAAAYRTILQPLDLTYPQYTVMSILWHADRRTVKDISSVLQSDYNTVSPLIKRLENRGLVHRNRNDTDDREVLVHLTPAGRVLEQSATSIQSDIQHATGLDETRHHRLVAGLQKLVQSLSATNGGRHR